MSAAEQGMTPEDPIVDRPPFAAFAADASTGSDDRRSERLARTGVVTPPSRTFLLQGSQ